MTTAEDREALNTVTVTVAVEHWTWPAADGRVEGRGQLSALVGLADVAAITLVARTLRNAPGGYTVPLLDHLTRFVPMPWPSGLRGAAVAGLRAIGTASRAVRASDAVVVYAPGLVGSLVGLLALLWRRRLAVVVVGDPAEALAPGMIRHPMARIAGRVIPQVQRSLCRRADVVRYVTQRVLQEHYPPSAHSSVFAFSDVRLDDVAAPRNYPAKSGVTVVTVTSLDQPYKGLSDLLQASRMCAESGHPVQLVVVGDGRLKEELMAQAEELLPDGSWRFVGHRSPRQVRDILNAADLFVLPSWTEGMPRALLEAMASGLPVVATRVGGIHEVLPPSQTSPPHRPADLARIMLRLMSDPAEWDAAARLSTAAASDFRIEALEERQSAFVRDLVRTAGADTLRGHV
ncbi:MAG: hypothetical protein QOG10_4285 [Kribbellaceae bacterium]|jgi:glycosyltransferase involved in cell wall biosynthesis|nr:hypothetical protein [Kribbellaceae bacterium]